MSFLSRFFGKAKSTPSKMDRDNFFRVPNADERMAWGIEKANLTLHYFAECLANPKPNQQYFTLKGRLSEDGQIEHIWLNDPECDETGNWFGVIGNVPMNIPSLQIGQKIGLGPDDISDWMILENGRLIGGYTIRAMREGLTGADLTRFDRNLGGIQVDEGEDYFIPDLSTPEGAISKLENAYNAGDLEAAMSCKDFEIEARLLLEKKLGSKAPQEVIEKAGEVLRLSFLQSMQENGIPNFKNTTHAFPVRKKINEQHYLITEVVRYPDGSSSSQQLNVYHTPEGWKVLGVEH